ncbi:hypothetical protein GG344DRAFT_64992 [Lentinula edodes]|nr:hypothetical protein GG344DRAFT_64992 [Lentinula edodes]
MLISDLHNGFSLGKDGGVTPGMTGPVGFDRGNECTFGRNVHSVPGCLIDDGAAAGSLAPFVDSTSATKDNNDLSEPYLLLVVSVLGSPWFGLVLTTIFSTIIYFMATISLDSMDVDQTAVQPSSFPTSLSTTASPPFEIVRFKGQDFRICRPVEPQPEDALVLPERYEHEGEIFYVRYHDLNGLKRSALVQIAKDCGLSSHQNMNILREKITEFSKDMVQWKTLLAGARRAHRGVRSGKIVKNELSPRHNKESSTSQTKKVKEKLSTLRRNALMGTSTNAPSGQILVAQRSKDMRTLEQKNQLLKLAKKFCDTHPYVPLEELNRRAKAKADAAKAQSASVLLSEQKRTNEKIDSLASMVGNLVQCLPTLFSAPFATSQSCSMSSLDSNFSTFRPVFAPPKLSTTFEELNMSDDNAELDAQANADSEPVAKKNCGHMGGMDNRVIIEKCDAENLAGVIAVPCSSSTQAETANIVSRTEVSTVHPPVVKDITTIKIAHGQVLNFNRADVHDPRQISFATNIPRLERVWDDEGTNWDPADCGTNLLSINGTPIALRYWPEVFSGKKDARWRALKKNWTEWKFVVERYRSSTPDAFWKEFTSTDGKCFNWKRICDTLRDQRAIHEQKIVDRAKAEYGADFDKVFMNRGKVLTDKTAIARRYLEKQTTDIN